jgi:phosphopantothenoylcysteine decarboxylase/phosphopantothenate--cysteine ligase
MLLSNGSQPKSGRKILFFMSGSIAAFKACQVISKLVQDGNEVQIVATESTFRFVGAATLEGLSGKPVLSDIWESGRAMDHIHLSRWADLGIVCPASANTLAKLALGLSEDVLSALILAWPDGKPLTIFPAMNGQMYSAVPTQNNIKSLQARGFFVAPTSSGPLACGEFGLGRMLEVENILEMTRAEPRGSVLITGGATREPIDGIRFLSNVSTGQTAATLADQLSRKGWDVTYLHGVGAALPKSTKKLKEFGSFADLDSQLHATLSAQAFSGVIHCAAVSDYSVINAQPGIKISSEKDLNIRFEKNYKILPRLREYSANKNVLIVGFKLTLNQDENETIAVARQGLSSAVDVIVANEWSAVARDRSQHPGVVLTAQLDDQNFSDLPSLADILNQMLTKGVPK